MVLPHWRGPSSATTGFRPKAFLTREKYHLRETICEILQRRCQISSLLMGSSVSNCGFQIEAVFTLRTARGPATRSRFQNGILNPPKSKLATRKRKNHKERRNNPKIESWPGFFCPNHSFAHLFCVLCVFLRHSNFGDFGRSAAL